MIDVELASLIAQVLIGAGQIGIVYYGISRMMQASGDRLLAGERQERQAERRHAETMAVLKDQGQALRDQGQALQAMILGLETVIERTGGRGTA